MRRRVVRHIVDRRVLPRRRTRIPRIVIISVSPEVASALPRHRGSVVAVESAVFPFLVLRLAFSFFLLPPLCLLRWFWRLSLIYPQPRVFDLSVLQSIVTKYDHLSYCCKKPVVVCVHLLKPFLRLGQRAHHLLVSARPSASDTNPKLGAP